MWVLVGICDFSLKKFQIAIPRKSGLCFGLSEKPWSPKPRSQSLIIRSFPAYLATVNPEKTLLPKIEFYGSLGISKEDIARTVSSNPLLLAMNLENRFYPLIISSRVFCFLRKMLLLLLKAASGFSWKATPRMW
ncbi:hypothetical protein M0R45_009626 [Rubus argutus]|uniref:Uncharacterized protein n=1 Tax=Rubus argutus TaxID=59490 RepID=A0AAW1Y8H4_RUBAR